MTDLSQLYHWHTLYVAAFLAFVVIFVVLSWRRQ
jgi:hypothetical protein